MWFWKKTPKLLSANYDLCFSWIMFCRKFSCCQHREIISVNEALHRNRQQEMRPDQRKRVGRQKMSMTHEDRHLLCIVRMNCFVSAPCLRMHRTIQILGDHMPSWARGVFRRNVVFVQDKAPTHVTCDTVAFLDQHDVEVRDSLAMSLDINPKEKCGTKGQSASKTWVVLFPIWPNCVQHFRQEGWGHWWRACLVLCGLFSLLQGDKRF